MRKWGELIGCVLFVCRVSPPKNASSGELHETLGHCYFQGFYTLCTIDAHRALVIRLIYLFG